ncbi:MAG: isochorismatase family protein [Armatimonadetes bacterium]|nr:isochorismatase family protein [Armatimonadota bacterium]
MSHPNLLNTSDTVLLVIDVQDVLLKATYEQERVVGNSVRLIETAKIFPLPILVTLQNAERFGDCNPCVANALPHTERFNKMTFSCLGGKDFIQQLEALNRKQILICGVETHVCVNQTAHDLLALGYSAHIAKDAVSSRTPENWAIGIEKMRDSGCIITSTETAIFELTYDASTPEFKKILPLVK